jgi:uncharacterized protein YndB with AHSA1/START domain
MELIAAAEALSTAAPERVWERLTDGLRWSDWSATAEWMVVERALESGGVVTIKRKRGRQTAYRIEHAEAPKRLALLLTFGSAAQLRIAWTLAAEGTGTRIRQTIETGGPLRRWLSMPLARRGAVDWANDPARLAEIAAAP